jgi:hypothetical protein
MADPHVQPEDDPLRSMIYFANDRACATSMSTGVGL